MKAPGYPANPGAWDAQRVALIALVAHGPIAQAQRAAVLLARELCARWYVSEWQVDASHFAFQALGVSPDADPATYPTSGAPAAGPNIAGLFSTYGGQGGASCPGGYVRRMATELLEDGSARNYEAPPRNPAIWAPVVAECSALAAELLG